MPEIDRKVRDGVRHEEIVETLQKAGIAVNLESFRKNLYRYRASLRKAGKVSAPDEPARVADGNPPVVSDEAEIPTAPTADQFETALDIRKRDEIGDKYLGKSRPIFGNKRSERK
ncbi:conserved hypothetical protein [Burkholderia latens]